MKRNFKLVLSPSLPVVLSPLLVILSGAKNLVLKLRVNSAKVLGVFLSFIGLFCLFGLNVYADMYFESKTTHNAPGQAGREILEKTYVTADKMKTVPSDGEIVIFRLDKGLMWIIDDSTKTYGEVTLKEMGGIMEEMIGIEEEAMAKMSPEERKQMEQFMPQRAEVKIEKTGKRKDVSGYKCELIIVTTGTERSEMWITEQIKYDKDVKKFFETIDSTFPMHLYSKGWAFWYPNLTEIEGLPMETRTTDTMGSMSDSSTSIIITKVEQKKISDSEFELPAGLKKMEVEENP